LHVVQTPYNNNSKPVHVVYTNVVQQLRKDMTVKQLKDQLNELDNRFDNVQVVIGETRIIYDVEVFTMDKKGRFNGEPDENTLLRIKEMTGMF